MAGNRRPAGPGFETGALRRIDMRIQFLQRRGMFCLDNLSAQFQIGGELPTGNCQGRAVIISPAGRW